MMEKQKQLEKSIGNIICQHDEYCLVKKLFDKAHCSKDYQEYCETARFYTRHGRDYILGTGNVK